MDDDYLEHFESPRLLIGQANAKIVDFEALCFAFCDPGNYEFIDEIDHKSREKVRCLRLKSKIPGAIRLAAYSILNDLRHALDQAVGDAALLTGRKDSKGVYFPVGKSVDDLKLEIKRRCRNVHPEILTFIQNLNVCETGNPRLYATLSLVGPNKHQRLIGIRPRNHLAIENFDPFGMRGPINFNATKWVPSKNHVELIRLGDGAYLNVKLHVILDVCLGNGEPPLDVTAQTILRELAGEVERIVTSIEAEARRIVAAGP